MTSAESERLAAIEEQVAGLDRQLRVTRARLDFLRALLAAEAPELARVEEDATRVLDTISRPSRPTESRPVLRVVEGDRSSERPPVHGRDRHGLRAV